MQKVVDATIQHFPRNRVRIRTWVLIAGATSVLQISCAVGQPEPPNLKGRRYTVEFGGDGREQLVLDVEGKDDAVALLEFDGEGGMVERVRWTAGDIGTESGPWGAMHESIGARPGASGRDFVALTDRNGYCVFRDNGTGSAACADDYNPYNDGWYAFSDQAGAPLIVAHKALSDQLMLGTWSDSDDRIDFREIGGESESLVGEFTADGERTYIESQAGTEVDGVWVVSSNYKNMILNWVNIPSARVEAVVLDSLPGGGRVAYDPSFEDFLVVFYDGDPGEPPYHATRMCRFEDRASGEVACKKVKDGRIMESAEVMSLRGETGPVVLFAELRLERNSGSMVHGYRGRPRYWLYREDGSSERVPDLSSEAVYVADVDGDGYDELIYQDWESDEFRLVVLRYTPGEGFVNPS